MKTPTITQRQEVARRLSLRAKHESAAYFIAEIIEALDLGDVIDGTTGVSMGLTIARLVDEGWEVRQPQRTNADA